MKTKTLHFKIAGTTTLMSACMAIFVTMNFSGKAQAPIAEESMITASRTEATSAGCMKEFTARVFGNTVYLSLIMKAEPENSVLLFEKSVNGKDYKVIGQNESFPSINNESDRLFSFQDPKPGAGKTFYRVLQLRQGGFFYSPTATVIVDKEVPLVAADE